jgi:RNA polymerase sigma-70 factor (ECF subfamily)
MTSSTTKLDRDDAALLRAIQSDTDSAAGQAATNELLGRYHRNVYLWCFTYIRDHDRAMDLCQDVMISALGGLPNFEGRAPFSAWLFKIARNRCHSAVRRQEPIVDAEIDMELFRDESPDPAQRVEQAQAEERLLELISKTLDPLEQKALWLRCIERFPVDELTEMLQVDSKTGARGVLQRARRKLRKALVLVVDESEDGRDHEP